MASRCRAVASSDGSYATVGRTKGDDWVLGLSGWLLGICTIISCTSLASSIAEDDSLLNASLLFVLDNIVEASLLLELPSLLSDAQSFSLGNDQLLPPLLNDGSGSSESLFQCL